MVTAFGLDPTSSAHVFALCTAWTFLAITLIWIVGLAQGNHSLIDGYYGFGFAVPVWIAYALSQAASATAAVLLVLTSLHGCRLGFYLTKRWWGYRRSTGGDQRYLGFRQKYAQGYWWKSLLIVTEPQALIIVLIGLPPVIGIATLRDAGAPLNLLQCAGVLIFAIGFYFEVVADGQLQAFKADPHNKGRYLRTGVWTHTRHPNYFGNCTVWWGIWIVTVAARPSLWWTVASPLFNTVMLTSLFGRALQDELMGKRPEYQQLMRETSSFLPLPRSKPPLP